jgi:hypothetical protein
VNGTGTIPYHTASVHICARWCTEHATARGLIHIHGAYPTVTACLTRGANGAQRQGGWLRKVGHTATVSLCHQVRIKKSGWLIAVCLRRVSPSELAVAQDSGRAVRVGWLPKGGRRFQSGQLRAATRRRPLRPCSFDLKTIGIEGDWKGLERILTCRGFKACLDNCRKHHDTPHAARRSCGGRIGRRTLGRVWRSTSASKQALNPPQSL